MVIRVLWTVLAAKEDTVSSVAYYIPIDQRQADELRHSADASAWAEERLEEVVLNGAPVVLVPAEAVSAIADALSGVGAEELEAAAENVRAEYPDVLLDDAATSLKALITLYREAAETGKTVAVVVS